MPDEHPSFSAFAIADLRGCIPIAKPIAAMPPTRSAAGVARLRQEAIAEIRPGFDRDVLGVRARFYNEPGCDIGVRWPCSVETESLETWTQLRDESLVVKIESLAGVKSKSFQNESLRTIKEL